MAGSTNYEISKVERRISNVEGVVWPLFIIRHSGTLRVFDIRHLSVSTAKAFGCSPPVDRSIGQFVDWSKNGQDVVGTAQCAKRMAHSEKCVGPKAKPKGDIA